MNRIRQEAKSVGLFILQKNLLRKLHIKLWNRIFSHSQCPLNSSQCNFYDHSSILDQARIQETHIVFHDYEENIDWHNDQIYKIKRVIDYSYSGINHFEGLWLL